MPLSNTTLELEFSFWILDDSFGDPDGTLLLNPLRTKGLEGTSTQHVYHVILPPILAPLGLAASSVEYGKAFFLLLPGNHDRSPYHVQRASVMGSCSEGR